MIKYLKTFSSCLKTKYLTMTESSSSTTQMLGRWKIKPNQESSEIINNFWNNSDHCGDIICGDPVKNKEFLNEKLKRLKNTHIKP